MSDKEKVTDGSPSVVSCLSVGMKINGGSESFLINESLPFVRSRSDPTGEHRGKKSDKGEGLHLEQLFFLP